MLISLAYALFPEAVYIWTKLEKDIPINLKEMQKKFKFIRVPYQRPRTEKDRYDSGLRYFNGFLSPFW